MRFVHFSSSIKLLTHPRLKINLLPILLQMREAIKFQYTNWSDPLDDESRFAAVKKLVADHQFDCPIDDTIELLASRFDVFRYVNCYILWFTFLST